jgi:hypothetical protein
MTSVVQSKSEDHNNGIQLYDPRTFSMEQKLRPHHLSHFLGNIHPRDLDLDL